MLDKSKVAFSAFWFEGMHSPGDVKRVCEDLSSLGYRGVEWKETCFGSGKDARDRLKIAAEATRNAGMEVTDFVILRNLTDPERSDATAEDICDFVRASATAGVKLVNTASGPVIPKSVPDDEWWRPAAPDWQRSWDTIEKTLGKVLKVAESEGVIIAFETILGTLVHDYYSTLELLRRLDSPNLALTLDPSHYLVHDNDIGYAIRSLGPKIGLVHVKDAVGRPGVFGRDFLFPILGEGAVNWQEFFQALDDIGYAGWLSLEFESFKYMNEVLHGEALKAARLSIDSYKALARDADA